ncbi:MAG: hypothetical protein UZ09_BCD002000422 [Bacteroidetes bacterium OLB9]|nr:MAG: hypothetical protein UZ09_BCD002000422 [Bacteroidetes bacterium OLB9]
MLSLSKHTLGAFASSGLSSIRCNVSGSPFFSICFLSVHFNPSWSIGLCGLQMCMAAKDWVTCLLSLSDRYSIVIQISLETDKRVPNCSNVTQFFFCVCNGVIFQYKQVANFGVVQFVNTLFHILAQNEV